jgi:hypothetical protein
MRCPVRVAKQFPNGSTEGQWTYPSASFFNTANMNASTRSPIPVPVDSRLPATLTDWNPFI